MVLREWANFQWHISDELYFPKHIGNLLINIWVLAFVSAWLMYTWAFLAWARPDRTRPAPKDLVGWVWTQILRPEKKILARARPEMLIFSYFTLQNALAARPKLGPYLSPARKLRPGVSSEMVVGRIFSTRNNQIFSARPEKYSGIYGLMPTQAHAPRGDAFVQVLH
jgi:hypothetical protein